MNVHSHLPKGTRNVKPIYIDRALREKVGTGFSQEQCSKLQESITFFAFGRNRLNAT
jgi:hypothetical protein